MRIKGAYKLAGFACGMALVGVMGVSLAAGPVAAENYYIGALGGVTHVEDSDIDFNAGGAGAIAEFDTGYTAGGMIGYRWDKGLRAELEGNYSESPGDEVTQAGVNVDLDGHYSITTIMFNAFWDFNPDDRWHPYVGGGLGVAFYQADFRFDTGTPARLKDDDWTGAMQALVGVNYDVSDSVTIGVGYKFFMPFTAPEFQGQTAAPAAFTLDASTLQHAGYVSMRVDLE